MKHPPLSIKQQGNVLYSNEAEFIKMNQFAGLNLRASTANKVAPPVRTNPIMNNSRFPSPTTSLPVIANVGITTAFYKYISADTFIAQMAGILIVYAWNYLASSSFVWKKSS